MKWRSEGAFRKERFSESSVPRSSYLFESTLSYTVALQASGLAVGVPFEIELNRGNNLGPKLSPHVYERFLRRD